MKKILIGIDDSKFAEHALAYGFELAHKLNAQVGLVHIVAPIVMPVNTSIDTMPVDTTFNEVNMIDIQNERAKTMIGNAIKKFGDEVSSIQHFTQYGDTAEGIINCSKDFKADMIVIGTHSRTGIDRLLMGSVAEHVIRHSEIPVLVVPTKHNE